MHRSVAITVSSIAIAAAGCGAHGPEPLHLRYAEMVQDPQASGFSFPMIVEFRPGDRLPVELHFDAESFDLAPATPPIELVAKTRCFVRFDRDGVRTSWDGVSFDRPKVPGHFQVGISKTPGGGTKLIVAITAPRHDPPK